MGVNLSREFGRRARWWMLIAATLLLTGCKMGNPNPVPSYVGTPQIHQAMASSSPSASDAVWGLDGTQSTYGALNSAASCRGGSGFS